MPFLADAHVHLYPEYSVANALRGASARLDTAAAAVLRGEKSFTKILCLTERETENYFQDMRAQRNVAGLPVSPTSEAVSLRIDLGDGDSLIVVNGKQVVSAERLEVLLLGCSQLPPPRASLESVVAWANEAGALPVLPWSFGKWTGTRGQAVMSFLERSARPASRAVFALGDILMRPSMLPEPPPFRWAREHGILCLTGSDPLPLPGEEHLIGSTYVWGEASISGETPWADLRAVLVGSPAMVRSGGKNGSVLDLLKRQLRYRFRRPVPTELSTA